MITNLEPWQIPRTPPKKKKNNLARLLFRIIFRVWNVFKRWYIEMETDAQVRAIKNIGLYPNIKGPIKITSPENVILGDDVNINPGFYAQSKGGLEIGNHVHFGQNVHILTQNHNYNKPECLPYDKIRISKPVIINDSVWIGDNVCIIPGITIGEGAIIALGSVVVKNVPPLAIVGGAPAIIIKMRNSNEYQRLKNEERYINWPYKKDKL